MFSAQYYTSSSKWTETVGCERGMSANAEGGWFNWKKSNMEWYLKWIWQWFVVVHCGQWSFYWVWLQSEGQGFCCCPIRVTRTNKVRFPARKYKDWKRDWSDRETHWDPGGGGGSGSIRVWEGTLEWNENQQKQPWYWDTIVAVTDREQSRMQIECNAHTQRVTSNATFNCNEYENWNLIYAKHLLNNHLINEKCTIYKTHLHACNNVSNMQTAYKLSMKPVLSLNIINTWWMPTVGWLV